MLEAYSKILKYAYEQGFEVVLMPALDATLYGFTHELIGKKVSNLINDFLYSLEYNNILFERK